MSVDRAKIDQQRATNNLDPLTDAEFIALGGEVEAPVLPPVDDAEKERLAEEERLRLEEEEKNKTVVPEVKLREPSEEELLEMASKRLGKKVSSWEDLKKPEEIDEAKKKEARDTDMVSWGLKNKLVSKAKYEGYIADSRDPQDLVFRQRLQEALKSDPDLNQDEFKEEFDEEFGLDQKPESRRYKNGQNNLKVLSAAILRSSYGDVLDLDNKYSQYESSANQQKERVEKVMAGAPAYKAALDSVKGKLQKIKGHFDDNQEYEVEAMEGTVDEIIELMSTPEFAEQQILKGYTEQQLADIAWSTYLTKNFPAITQKIVDQQLLKKAAGTKGVLKIGGAGVVNNELELTDAQKKYRDIQAQENEKNKVATTAN